MKMIKRNMMVLRDKRRDKKRSKRVKKKVTSREKETKVVEEEKKRRGNGRIEVGGESARTESRNRLCNKKKRNLWN
jgi:membrane protein implicated in regulation of membrane protease activity